MKLHSEFILNEQVLKDSKEKQTWFTAGKTFQKTECQYTAFVKNKTFVQIGCTDCDEKNLIRREWLKLQKHN